MNLLVQGLYHLFVAEYVIHCWQTGLPAGEVCGRLDHMGIRNVANAHPGFIRVVSNGPQIPDDEVVYGNGLT